MTGPSTQRQRSLGNSVTVAFGGANDVYERPQRHSVSSSAARSPYELAARPTIVQSTTGWALITMSPVKRHEHILDGHRHALRKELAQALVCQRHL